MKTNKSRISYCKKYYLKTTWNLKKSNRWARLAFSIILIDKYHLFYLSSDESINDWVNSSNLVLEMSV